MLSCCAKNMFQIIWEKHWNIASTLQRVRMRSQNLGLFCDILSTPRLCITHKCYTFLESLWQEHSKNIWHLGPHDESAVLQLIFKNKFTNLNYFVSLYSHVWVICAGIFHETSTSHNPLLCIEKKSVWPSCWNYWAITWNLLKC